MFTLVSGFRLNPFPIRFVFLHVYVEIRKYLEPMFSKHYYSLIGLQLFNVSIHYVYTIYLKMILEWKYYDSKWILYRESYIFIHGLLIYLHSIDLQFLFNKYYDN